MVAGLLGWARTEKTTDSPGYRIEVKVKGFTEDTMYLAYHMGDKQYMRDTVAVTDGKAVFQGAEPLEGGIYLVVLPPSNQYFEVIVTDDQEFTLQTEREDLVGKMKVTGSKENEIFFSNLQTINNLGSQAETLEKQIKEAGDDSVTVEKLKGQLQATFDAMAEVRNKLIEEHPESFYAKVLLAMKDPEVPEAPEGAPENFAFYYYRDHYFDHLDFGDKRMLRTPVLHTKMMTYMSRLTVQH